MTIETNKYVRKPLYVDAIQVTRENIFEVSMWCGGDIVWKRNPDGAGDPGEVDHIRVRVHSPVSERQKQAHVGDWVLYANRGYKIYTPRAFEKTFDPNETPAETWTRERAAGKYFRGPAQNG